MFVTHQPRSFCISVLFALILLVVSQLVNYCIKSSLHVSFSIYLSSLILMLNYEVGIGAFLFTGLIGWSRVKLGRHTVKEVIVGFFIGVVLSMIMLYSEGYILC